MRGAPRYWVYRGPRTAASWVPVGLLGSLMVMFAFSRPLPPAPVSPSEPMVSSAGLGQLADRLPVGGDELVAWLEDQLGALGLEPVTVDGLRGTVIGGRHDETLLITVEGRLQPLLVELAKALAAHRFLRSVTLVPSRGVRAPAGLQAVVCHVHVRHFPQASPGVRVGAGAGPLPLWLRELGRAAALREAMSAPGGMYVQLVERATLLWRGWPVAAEREVPAVVLTGGGQGVEALVALARTVERVVHSLDELPAVPSARQLGGGRTGSLYLVIGPRYVPGPALVLAQLLCLAPLVPALLHGRPRSGRGKLPDDAAILAAVQALRTARGRMPPVPEETRMGRRRRRRRSMDGARTLAAEAAGCALPLGLLLALAAGWRWTLEPGIARQAAAVTATGLGLAVAGWLAGSAGSGSWTDRHRALLTLLALACALGLAGSLGNPAMTVALIPAVWLWPGLGPGRPGRNRLRVLAGLAGGAWLVATALTGAWGSPVARHLLSPTPGAVILLLFLSLGFRAWTLAGDRDAEGGRQACEDC